MLLLAAAATAAAATAARQFIHVPRARVIDRCTGKITSTPFVPASTSTTSGVGAGEDQLPPAAGSSLRATNSFWDVAPLLTNARYLGISSLPPVDKGLVGRGGVVCRFAGADAWSQSSKG